MSSPTLQGAAKVSVLVSLLVASTLVAIWFLLRERVVLRPWVQSIDVVQQDGRLVYRAHFDVPELGELTREVSKAEWRRLHGDLRLGLSYAAAALRSQRIGFWHRGNPRTQS